MQRGVPAFSKPPSAGFRFSNTSPIIPVNNTNYSNNKQKQQRVRIDVSRLQQQQQQQSSSSDDEEDQTTKPLPSSSPPPPPLLDTLPAIQHQQRPEATAATALATAVVSSPLVVPHNVVRIAAGILMIWALGITLVVIIHMRANSSSSTTTIALTNAFSASFVVEQNGQTYSFAVDLVDRAAYYHMCCTDTEGATRCGIDVRHIGVHIVDKKATINVHFPPRVYLSKCTLFCTRAR